MPTIEQTLSLINELPNRGFFFWLRIILVTLSILMLVAIVWLLFSTSWLKERYGYDLRDLLGPKKEKRGRLAQELEKIQSKIKSPDPKSWREAVILAIQLLDDFLKVREISGKTFEEKLKNIPQEILSREKVNQLKLSWNFYQNLIQNQALRPSQDQAQRIVNELEKALFELTELGV